MTCGWAVNASNSSTRIVVDSSEVATETPRAQVTATGGRPIVAAKTLVEGERTQSLSISARFRRRAEPLDMEGYVPPRIFHDPDDVTVDYVLTRPMIVRPT